MKIAVIISSCNQAGPTIKENLLEFDFKDIGSDFEGKKVYELDGKHQIRIYTTEKSSVYCENIDKEIDADLFIFATSHKSAEKKPSLCVHTPGNWDKDDLGGKEKTINFAYPQLVRFAFENLNKFNDLDYEVVMECTHHGPYMEKPVMFIELGSCEENWKDKKAGKVVADALMESLTKEIPKYIVCIGLGGPHYCPNFIKVMEKSDCCFGHVCPKYALENFDEEMMKQTIEKSSFFGEVDFVIVDWKGLQQYKEKIESLLEKMKLNWKKTKEF